MHTPGWIEGIYFVAAVLFIIGLRRMSSPLTARGGILWAGAGMLVATMVTFWHPSMGNAGWIILAMLIGGSLAWISGKRVAMTEMPQMIALYNGMGGGAAAAVAAIEWMRGIDSGIAIATMALLGALIGATAFSGSLVAFAKLQGLLKRPFRIPHIQWGNLALLLIAAMLALWLLQDISEPSHFALFCFFLLALVLGVTLALPIGGADMPVVISLFNALTGLAVGLEGYVLQNPAMMIAGTVVGASGTLLTQLMAKAMNRSVFSVFFQQFGGQQEQSSDATAGSFKPIDSTDAAIMMAYSERVIIIPGYGMAVAQAQHKIWELTTQLQQRGVQVHFAIHPVAGRMPGHMNVLLAEAGVPYDLISDLEEINPLFPRADVALVIGANDVVNPAAVTSPDSPIHGMPILDAYRARQIVVIKRGQGTGFSGIENALFTADNTRMLYGDGQQVSESLVHAVKAL